MIQGGVVGRVGRCIGQFALQWSHKSASDVLLKIHYGMYKSHSSGLLDADHHGIVAGKRLNPRLCEARLAHPGGTRSPGKIKAAMRINEHVQAHEQTIGVLAPVVVNEGLVHEEGVGLRHIGIRLARTRQHAEGNESIEEVPGGARAGPR
jgi:hypothetical protein